jgi:hypothetical protein
LKRKRKEKSNENDQKERRTERGVIGEDEEVNSLKREEIGKCIQTERIIKHQEKTA